MKRLERISIEEFIDKCNETKIIKNLEGAGCALREFQTFCLEFMDKTKYGLVRKDRQAGGTTVFVLFLIYKILYDSDARTFAILSTKMDNSKEFLYRFKMFFDVITKCFKIEDCVKFLVNNRTDVKIVVNDIEKIITTCSGYSENFFRGKQIDYLFGDEITYLKIHNKKEHVDEFEDCYVDRFLKAVILNPKCSDYDMCSILNALLNSKAISESVLKKQTLQDSGFIEYSSIISLYCGQIRAWIIRFFTKYKETRENTRLILDDIIKLIVTTYCYNDYIKSLELCCKNILFNGTSCNKDMNLFDYLWFDFSPVIFEKYYINRTSKRRT